MGYNVTVWAIMSLCGYYRGFGKRKTEEMGIQTFPRNSQWRRRRDVLRGQSIPQSGSGDQKNSIADGKKRVRRTTIDDDESELRRWWASMSDNWWNSSAKSSIKWWLWCPYFVASASGNC